MPTNCRCGKPKIAGREKKKKKEDDTNHGIHKNKRHKRFDANKTDRNCTGKRALACRRKPNINWDPS